MDDEDVIVVTGYARTGTTLMQGLLCASPDVMPVSAECVYLKGLVDAYHLGKLRWDRYTADVFGDQEAFLAFNRQVCADYLRQVRRRFETDRRLLQKAPQGQALRLVETAELLPDAKFVVMVRDPRDAICSQMVRFSRSGAKGDFQGEVNAFTGIYGAIRQHRAVFAGRLALVRYESLTTEPESVLPVLADFLGIRLPVETAQQGWDVKRPAGDAKASPLDGKPVSSERIGGHVGVLSPGAAAVLDNSRERIERISGFDVFVDGSAAGRTAVMLA